MLSRGGPGDLPPTKILGSEAPVVDSVSCMLSPFTAGEFGVSRVIAGQGTWKLAPGFPSLPRELLFPLLFALSPVAVVNHSCVSDW